MDWTRKFLLIIGLYLLVLNFTFCHHLSGSNSLGRRTSRRISSGRSNGNQFLRIQTSSTSINRQNPSRSRTGPRPSQASGISALEQEVISLRRRLALAEEQKLRSSGSRQRLSQSRISHLRQTPQSRRTVRLNSLGQNRNTRIISGSSFQNVNRRRTTSSRRNTVPQIVIELERDIQKPGENFNDAPVSFQTTSQHNNHHGNVDAGINEQQLLQMLEKVLATNAPPSNTRRNNNQQNDVVNLLQQLQNDPNLAQQLQQVLSHKPHDVNHHQAPPRNHHPVKPSPRPQTLWEQVNSLSDPRKARELRQKDPLHFAFLTSLLEGDIPDPPDVPDPLPHHPPPRKIEGKIQDHSNGAISPKTETKVIKPAGQDKAKKSQATAEITGVKGKSRNVQHLADAPVFQATGSKTPLDTQQPKIIVIREGTSGQNPFVVQTDKFGQSSIVIDTGNPQLRQIVHVPTKPEGKGSPVVSASSILVDGKSPTVVQKSVETKVSAKDSGAITVKKEMNTNSVSTSGQAEQKITTKVELTTVVPAEVTSVAVETTEAV